MNKFPTDKALSLDLYKSSPSVSSIILSFEGSLETLIGYLNNGGFLVTVSTVEGLRTCSFEDLREFIDKIPYPSLKSELLKLLEGNSEDQFKLAYEFNKVSTFCFGLTSALSILSHRGRNQFNDVADIRTELREMKSQLPVEVFHLIWWMIQPIPYCRPTLSAVKTRLNFFSLEGKSFPTLPKYSELEMALSAIVRQLDPSSRLDFKDSITAPFLFKKEQVDSVRDWYSSSNTFLPVFVRIGATKFGSINSGGDDLLSLVVVPFEKGLTAQVIIHLVYELLPLSSRPRDFELLFGDGLIHSLAPLLKLLEENAKKGVLNLRRIVPGDLIVYRDLGIHHSRGVSDILKPTDDISYDMSPKTYIQESLEAPTPYLPSLKAQTFTDVFSGYSLSKWGKLHHDYSNRELTIRSAGLHSCRINIPESFQPGSGCFAFKVFNTSSIISSFGFVVKDEKYEFNTDGKLLVPQSKLREVTQPLVNETEVCVEWSDVSLKRDYLSVSIYVNRVRIGAVMMVPIERSGDGKPNYQSCFPFVSSTWKSVSKSTSTKVLELINPPVLSFDARPDRHHPRVQVSANSQVIWNAQKWGTALVNHPGVTHGVLELTVRMEDSEHGAGVAVGIVDMSTFDCRKKNLGASEGSWCYSKTGKKGDGKGFQQFGRPFSSGDELTIRLDCDRKELSFGLNGAPPDVAYGPDSDLFTKPPGGGVRKLVPAVCLGSTEGSKKALLVLVLPRHSRPRFHRFLGALLSSDEMGISKDTKVISQSTQVNRTCQIEFSDDGRTAECEKNSLLLLDIPPEGGRHFSFAAEIVGSTTIGFIGLKDDERDQLFYDSAAKQLASGSSNSQNASLSLVSLSSFPSVYMRGTHIYRGSEPVVAADPLLQSVLTSSGLLKPASTQGIKSNMNVMGGLHASKGAGGQGTFGLEAGEWDLAPCTVTVEIVPDIISQDSKNPVTNNVIYFWVNGRLIERAVVFPRKDDCKLYPFVALEPGQMATSNSVTLVHPCVTRFRQTRHSERDTPTSTYTLPPAEVDKDPTYLDVFYTNPLYMNRNRQISWKDCWTTFLADHPGVSSGKLSFSVKIQGDGGIAIGFVDGDVFKPVMQNLGATEHTWAISRTGKKSCGDADGFQPYSEKFGDGNVITAEVDMNNGSTFFYKDGSPLGLAFSNVIGKNPLKNAPSSKSTPVSSKIVELSESPTVLVPAVCLGSNTGGKACTVELCDFRLS